MKTYTNIDEFLRENNLDKNNDHEKRFKRVVKELGFDICKNILLRRLEQDGVTIKDLKEKYEQDKYLNNIYRSNSRNVLEWDFIGDDMLHNPNAKIKFKLMSSCNRTCIAKACAIMVVEKLLKQRGKNMEQSKEFYYGNGNCLIQQVEDDYITAEVFPNAQANESFEKAEFETIAKIETWVNHGIIRDDLQVPTDMTEQEKKEYYDTIVQFAKRLTKEN